MRFEGIRLGYRRHLTTAQRAAIAAELATMERGNPTGANQHTAGKGQNCTFPKDAMSIDQLAEALSVSPRSVKAAKARMKKMIEGKFRADAKAAQVEAGKVFGRGKPIGSDHVIGTYKSGEAREKIAKAIGIGSSASMERAERVVENGIPELVDAMDSGEGSRSMTPGRRPPPSWAEPRFLREGPNESPQSEGMPKRHAYLTRVLASLTSWRPAGMLGV